MLGRLDDYATRSGYVITPVLMWGGEARGLQANEAEVASIHRIATQVTAARRCAAAQHRARG